MKSEIVQTLQNSEIVQTRWVGGNISRPVSTSDNFSRRWINFKSKQLYFNLMENNKKQKTFQPQIPATRSSKVPENKKEADTENRKLCHLRSRRSDPSSISG